MKIRILESARQDLLDGYYFYEKQADGIGAYFLNALFQISILSLTMRAFTLFILANIIACWRPGFRLRFITKSPGKMF